MRYLKTGIVFVVLVLVFSGFTSVNFSVFVAKFIKDYEHLHLPAFTFDYRDFFASVPSGEDLVLQNNFFDKKKEELRMYDRSKLDHKQKMLYDNIDYEIEFNLQRIRLEKEWVREGRKVPVGGLHGLVNFKDWYVFFIRKYTGLDMTAERVMELGKKEVERVKAEILKLRTQLGFKDSISFYTHLRSDEFYLTNKDLIIKEFSKIDSTVRKNLSKLVGQVNVPPVYPMEWPDAGANTPPGIYLSEADNPYGKHVFQFNFYGKRFNKRAMEWLYMHEAIPGHHLQFSMRSMYKISTQLSDLFIYPGNFEGWACYIEYFGKDVGLFQDDYSYLGKWEWDLVRSTRLVLDAGIHYYGWTHDEAIAFWKKTIPGQDDIAEREVTRVTNWAGQTVSYKAGADFIFKLKEKWLAKNPGKSPAVFHHEYLKAGRVPLSVVEKNIL
jgi:uncharacterized protein (DUF885 family)